MNKLNATIWLENVLSSFAETIFGVMFRIQFSFSFLPQKHFLEGVNERIRERKKDGMRIS